MCHPNRDESPDRACLAVLHAAAVAAAETLTRHDADARTALRAWRMSADLAEFELSESARAEVIASNRFAEVVP